mgnify:CR=1 FL=1
MREWEAGGGPSPLLLLALVWALPEGSMTKALMRGGREHFGWDLHAEIAASTFDAVNLNTRSSGNWKNKPPELPAFARPKSSKRSSKKKGKRTLADVRSLITG